MTIRNEYDSIKLHQMNEGVLYMESRELLMNLRQSTGMNRREFAEYFEIPYRTIQEWELGNRRIPEYLLRLMTYKIGIEDEKGNLNIRKE